MKKIFLALGFCTLLTGQCSARTFSVFNDETYLRCKKSSTNASDALEECKKAIKELDPQAKELDSPVKGILAYQLNPHSNSNSNSNSNSLLQQMRNASSRRKESTEIVVIAPRPDTEYQPMSRVQVCQESKKTADKIVFDFPPVDAAVLRACNLNFWRTNVGVVACKTQDDLISQISTHLKTNGMPQIQSGQFEEKTIDGQKFYFKDVYSNPAEQKITGGQEPVRAVVAYSADKNASDLYLGAVMTMGPKFTQIKEDVFQRALVDFFKEKNSQTVEKKLEQVGTTHYISSTLSDFFFPTKIRRGRSAKRVMKAKPLTKRTARKIRVRQ